MVELAQLFQDLDTIVMEQEPLVANIEQKGEEVHDNVVKANEEIGGAIVKARSARRKKWWCLLICSKLHPQGRSLWRVSLRSSQSSSLSSSSSSLLSLSKSTRNDPPTPTYSVSACESNASRVSLICDFNSVEIGGLLSIRAKVDSEPSTRKLRTPGHIEICVNYLDWTGIFLAFLYVRLRLFVI
jgi:hypothetical protein